MKYKKHKPILRQITYIFIGITIVLLVFVGVYAYSLMNNPDYITLGVGESYTLDSAEDEYIVRTYNADVITPESGTTVRAQNTGDAVVCVKYTYFYRDFYRFKVIEAPQDITLSTNQVHLGVTESYTLSAQSSTNQKDFFINYTSTNEAVATVDENGKITANDVGECEIIATDYTNNSLSCNVTVSDAVSQLYLSKSKVTLGKSETFTIEPVFKENEYSNTVKFKSSDETVASISNGTVTANAVGECKITATTQDGISATCEVIVKKLPKKLKLTVLDKYIIGNKIEVTTDMKKSEAASEITLSVSDDSVLKVDKDNPMLLHCKKRGKCKITLSLKNGVKAEKTVTVSSLSKNNIDFNILNQYPTLPTGCEVVSLTSVLNHYGYDVSMTTMADEYMPRFDGSYYTVSPQDYYLGDPYTKDGFGCFPQCIVKTAHNYFEDKKIDSYYAKDITGCSADELYNYLENDIPVITWVTSGFEEPSVDGTWEVDGETIVWCNYEHCLVTTGYDKDSQTVTVADDAGGYSYTVSMSKFERVFEGVGSMAVVLIKK